LPECIVKALLTHQKKAILKCLKRNGRIILNDELGLGKRLVAISCAIVYKTEWPLLIVCPQVLVQVWREEFVKWIPNFDLTKIQVFMDSHVTQDGILKPETKIVIISYQTLS